MVNAPEIAARQAELTARWHQTATAAGRVNIPITITMPTTRTSSTTVSAVRHNSSR